MPENKIVKRCVWCRPAHLMDCQGNPIPGQIEKNVRYSDGLCKIAEKAFESDINKYETKKGRN